ncbi:hypothetical protein CYMTET_34081, partial [Cymbomonas tetramitiformis]
AAVQLVYAPFFEWLEWAQALEIAVAITASGLMLSILATYLLSKQMLIEVVILELSRSMKTLRSFTAVVVRPFSIVGAGALEALLAASAGLGYCVAPVLGVP